MCVRTYASACMCVGACDFGSRQRSKRRKLTFILGRRVNFLASGLHDGRFASLATKFQAQHPNRSQEGSRETCNKRGFLCVVSDRCNAYESKE